MAWEKIAGTEERVWKEEPIDDRHVLTVRIEVRAPNESADYAQYLFDQTLDFFQANVTRWNGENENGVRFILSI